MSCEPIAEAERFDPPSMRVEWRTTEPEPFDRILRRLQARVGSVALARLLRHRGLHVDGRPVGEEDAPTELAAGTRVVAWVLVRDPDPIEIGADRVLFQEEGVVAVEKPAWLPVQGTRASQRFSLEASLRELLRCPELRAVHRLDRETSGVVLFARDAGSASFLGRQLAARRIRRTYLAVVSPPPAACFEVEGAMRRILDPHRIRFALGSTAARPGRPSRTRFTRLGISGDRALVRAEPETGRTHQIRVHLASAGSPIVGDRLYGPAAAAGPGRCLLHASRLELALPSAPGRAIIVESKPPADFHAEDFGRPG